MKKRYLAIALALASCSKDDPIVQYEVIEVPKVSEYLNNRVGDIFNTSLIDADITSSIDFKLVNDLNYKDYNHLIVNKSDNHPVHSGDKSLRFELNEGDCSYNINFNDCNNDRFRTELFESNRVNLESDAVVSYEFNIFLVKNDYFNPGSINDPYTPLTIISQIFFDDTGIEGDEKGQFYLLVDHNQNLSIRTHKPFTYNIDDERVLLTNIFDKWINVKMVINNKDSLFQVFVNGNVAYQKSYDFIPEQYINPQYYFKAGIYNAFKSKAYRAYKNQVIYFDNLQRFID
jgi:hypothetical protein